MYYFNSTCISLRNVVMNKYRTRQRDDRLIHGDAGTVCTHFQMNSQYMNIL